MAERSKAAVLKTAGGVTRPGVRIPFPPPFHCCTLLIIRWLQYILFCWSCFRSVPVASLETLSIFKKIKNSYRNVGGLSGGEGMPSLWGGSSVSLTVTMQGREH